MIFVSFFLETFLLFWTSAICSLVLKNVMKRILDELSL
jgi:hypothetical protein